MDKVGDKIYRLRSDMGISQEELGFRIGVTRQTISQWEANRRKINPAKIQLLCNTFKVDPDYFADEIDDEYDDGFARVDGQKQQLSVYEPQQVSPIPENLGYEEEACSDTVEEKPLRDFSMENDESVAVKKPSFIKARIVIVVSVTLAMIALGLLLIICLTSTPKSNGNIMSVHVFNFNFKDVSILLLCFSAVDAMISAIVTAMYKKRIRKKSTMKNNN